MLVTKASNPASRTATGRGWSLVAAVNNESVLNNTLLASPAIDDRCEVILRRGYANTGKAYNSGLDEATHEIVVFAHQDVYLPDDWMANLRHAIDLLPAGGMRWGVLGCFGVTREQPPRPRGFCYSTGLKSILGEPFHSPIPAQTLDELVLVVHRSSGLRFDEQLPGFHLYGADICLQAAEQGLESYIVPAFCIHNANGIVRLSSDFWRAYFYLRSKWRQALPITTCCTTITRGCLPMLHRIAVESKERVFPRRVGKRCENVTALCEELLRAHPETHAEPVLS